MFCGECGTKNKKGSLFCESCGAKIEQEEINETKETTEKKEVVKKNPPKKSTIIIGAVVVLLIGAYMILSNLFNPKNIAEGYFKAIVNADYDKLYDYLEVSDSEFTTKKIFKELMKDSEKIEVVNYTVGKVEKSDDGLTATVNVNFLLKGSEDSEDLKIKLVKGKDKKLLLFEDWKISTGGFSTVKDFEFHVPKDSKLVIEGVEVKDKYLDSEKSTESLDVYKIPTLFGTDYKVKVTLPLGIDLEENVDVSSKSYYKVYFDEDNLTEEVKNKILSAAKNDLQTIYNNAKDNKTWDEIKNTYEYKNGDVEDVKDAYEKLASYLSSSSNTLTSINFTNTKISSASLNSNGYLYVSVRADFSYSISYKSGEETKTHDGKDYDYVYLTYDYVDSKFKLIDVTSLNTYFSKYN